MEASPLLSGAESGGPMLLSPSSSPLGLERGREACPDPEILQHLKSWVFNPKTVSALPGCPPPPLHRGL